MGLSEGLRLGCKSVSSERFLGDIIVQVNAEIFEGEDCPQCSVGRVGHYWEIDICLCARVAFLGLYSRYVEKSIS